MTYRVNARSSFEFGNSFLDTKDSSRQLENSLVILPYGQFLQNCFYGGSGFRINTATKLHLPSGQCGHHGQSGGRVERAASTKWARRARHPRPEPHHQQQPLGELFLSSCAAAAADWRQPHRRQPGDFGIRLPDDPHALLRLSGGGIEGSESAFNGAAVVEDQLGGLWLAGGYQHYLGFFDGLPLAGGPTLGTQEFANGVGPVSVYQVISLRASGQLTRRWKLMGMGEVAGRIEPQRLSEP